MTNWVKAANPLARNETTADATAAARMSAVALWLTAAKDLALLVIYLGSLAKLTEATAQAGPNGPVIALGLLGFTVLVQVAVGLYQWKRPGSVVPIIVGMLTAYAVYEAVVKLVGGAGLMPVISLGVLVVALVLHIAAVRGAGVLEKQQSPA